MLCVCNAACLDPMPPAPEQKLTVTEFARSGNLPYSRTYPHPADDQPVEIAIVHVARDWKQIKVRLGRLLDSRGRMLAKAVDDASDLSGQVLEIGDAMDRLPGGLDCDDNTLGITQRNGVVWWPVRDEDGGYLDEETAQQHLDIPIEEAAGWIGVLTDIDKHTVEQLVASALFDQSHSEELDEDDDS